MKETWMYHINPTFKLFVMLVVFILILLIHNPNTLLNVTMLLFLLFLLFNGHSLKVVLLLLLPFLLIFVSTSSSMIMFGKGDTTWVKWGLIHITEESFFRGIHIGLRALAFGLLGLLFSLTTKPVNLFYSLMQQARLSPKYAYSFLAGYRLIPIMLEEFQVIHRAMKVRGVGRQKGWSGIVNKLKAYTIPLLSQSIRRAFRIGVAMEAKQFTTNAKRTYYYKIGFSKRDLYFVCVISLILTSAYILSTHFPYVPIQDVRYETTLTL
ncbi:energy-coupling factor transporter transmembrane component T family protein [Bacillus suaedaesalsae]|nr:energy-coupling factor transporter transmembrane component T [Bacillus suaedaesalsae]